VLDVLLDLRGPEFLVAYALLFGVALGIAHAVPPLATPRGDGEAARSWASRAAAEDLAFLARGAVGIAESALATLVASGRAAYDEALKGFSRAGQRTAHDGSLAVQAAFRALPGRGDVATLGHVLAAVEPVVESVERRLVGARLAVSRGTAARIAWASSALLWIVAALGATKVWIGVERERPVVILVVAVAGTVVLAARAVAKRRQTTAAGDALLRELRGEHDPLLAACERPKRLEPEQVGLAVALFGAAAVTELAVWFPGMREVGWLGRGDPSSGGSGCGSSGCGGGGCGGGGCGGCGS
jgi:uncharacterized protein (TIGR04222 family)